MKIVIVLDHPYGIESAENVPHKRSFTAAVTAASIGGAEQAGHEIDLIDLARDGFDPAMTRDDLVAWRQKKVIDPLVADYQRRLLAADHLAFVFPIWWEAMPAMTKGFLDRVLAKGVMFDEIEGAKGNPFRNGMDRLGGVTLLTVMTTPDKAYRWWYKDPVTKIMFKGTFGKIGVKNLRWRNYAAVTEKTPEQRERMLDETHRYFLTLGAGKAPRGVGPVVAASGV